MPMPMKMSSYEIPSFILSRYIEPYAIQCYLISVEYQQADSNKLLIMVLKDCASINGAIHLKLNDIINNLMQRYKIADAKPEWIIKETLFLVKRVLQSYFYHKSEFELRRPVP